MPVQNNTNAYETESSSHLLETRRTEINKQHWNRAKSQLLADNEKILLSDAHWAVLKFLRRNYVTAGLPRHARYLSDTLDYKFSAEGGKKYLRNLFPGGVITQGCRMANLTSPANARDASFGCCY